MMDTFYVATNHTRVPDTRITAADVYDLGERIAAHLARHKVIRPGYRYDAEVGNEAGSIWQPGLPRPINFHISKEN